MADFRASRAEGIPCSGTVVLPDGTAVCNPGTRTGWIGGSMPRGTPVLIDDDPSAYDRLVSEALPVTGGVNGADTAPRVLRDNGRMRFLGDSRPAYDLTYSDVFMVPTAPSVGSRLEVDLTTPGPAWARRSRSSSPT